MKLNKDDLHRLLSSVSQTVAATAKLYSKATTDDERAFYARELPAITSLYNRLSKLKPIELELDDPEPEDEEDEEG